MKIGFIGTGNMASALIEGFNIDGKNVYVSNKTPKKALDIAEKFSLNFCEKNIDVCKNSDIIFVCVKPNMYKDVLSEVLEYIQGKIIVSIAAGISIDFIKEVTLDKCKIVRTMPNTPAQVLCGMTGICFDDKILSNEKDFIITLFEGVGQIIEVLESQMHAVVALSGSSPAYGYMFIEAMAKAGVELGMDYEKALILASQSILGSAKMIIDTKIPPQTLTKNVCSPNGTTIEGVAVLENDIDELMMKTLKAVSNRSEEMSKN